MLRRFSTDQKKRRGFRSGKASTGKRKKKGENRKKEGLTTAKASSGYKSYINVFVSSQNSCLFKCHSLESTRGTFWVFFQSFSRFPAKPSTIRRNTRYKVGLLFMGFLLSLILHSFVENFESTKIANDGWFGCSGDNFFFLLSLSFFEPNLMCGN